MNILDGYWGYNQEENNKNAEFLKALGIPITNNSWDWQGPTIAAADLIDILNDDKKIKEVLTRLKLKAFW